MGAVRGVAQTLSYEIRIAVIVFGLLVLGANLNLVGVRRVRIKERVWIICLPLFLMWVIRGVAETNRTPFDFAEGESELVSGFNIEYGGGGFALIFMAEYAIIMFFSILRVQLFGFRDKILVTVFLSLLLICTWV